MSGDILLTGIWTVTFLREKESRPHYKTVEFNF